MLTAMILHSNNKILTYCKKNMSNQSIDEIFISWTECMRQFFRKNLHLKIFIIYVDFEKVTNLFLKKLQILEAQHCTFPSCAYVLCRKSWRTTPLVTNLWTQNWCAPAYVQIWHFEFGFLDLKIWILIFRLWILYLKFRIFVFGIKNLIFGFEIYNFGYCIFNFKLWFPDFKICV